MVGVLVNHLFIIPCIFSTQDTVKQQAMEKQATITKPKQKRRIWSVPKGLGKSPLTKRQSSAPAKLATPTSPVSPTTPGDDLTSVKTVK